MSFSSQSMKRRFPAWSKVRRDDSCNYSVLLNTIGEEVDMLRVSGEAMKLQQRNLLSNPYFEESKLFKFDLRKDSDYFTELKNKTITSISLTKGLEDIPIQFSWNIFCFAYPDSYVFKKQEAILDIRIPANASYEETLVLQTPKQLYINLENIESYEDDTRVQHGVTIRGKNSSGSFIEEYLDLSEKRTYKTKSFFKSVETLPAINEAANRSEIRGGPAIEPFGFDQGELRICSCAFGISRDKVDSIATGSDYNPFEETVYFNDTTNQNDIFVEKDFREASTNIKLIHKFVRNEAINLVSKSKIEKEFFEEEICTTTLLTDTDLDYVSTDWCIDKKRKEVVTIGVDKKLRFYKLKKPDIERVPLISESKDIDIVLESVSNYYVKGDKAVLNVNLERPKGPVANYLVIKTTSEDAYVTPYYLNNNKEWVEEPYLFSGKDLENMYENISPGIYFEDIVSADQVDYYVCSLRNTIDYDSSSELIEKINALIERDKKGYYSNKFSVSSRGIKPNKTIDLSNLLGDEDCEISIEEIDNLLFIKQGSLTSSYKEVKNLAFFSQGYEAIYLKEQYDETLSLQIDYEDGTIFRSELIYGDN